MATNLGAQVKDIKLHEAFGMGGCATVPGYSICEVSGSKPMEGRYGFGYQNRPMGLSRSM